MWELERVPSGSMCVVGSHFLFIVLMTPVPRVLVPVVLRSAAILGRAPSVVQKTALSRAKGTLDRRLPDYLALFGEADTVTALRDVMDCHTARVWRYLLWRGLTAAPLPPLLVHLF